MLLAIDIGNSNCVLGLYHQQQWHKQWRIQSNTQSTSDEYAVLLQNLLKFSNVTFNDLSQIAICSVVPQLTELFYELFKHHCQLTPFLLQHDNQTIIDVRPQPANKTGNDLIANAIAAYLRYQQDCIVIDFGTATTLSAICKPGILLGGAIAAGIYTTINALVHNTSQLPEIAITQPSSIIGQDTVSAMQSGLILGHISMIEGLVTRMSAELEKPRVIATGGLSTTLAPFIKVIDDIDPWLTLEGCRLSIQKIKGVKSSFDTGYSVT